MAKRLLPIWAQSSLIGNVIGIIPGAGMIMAIFMAYDQASRRRPEPGIRNRRAGGSSRLPSPPTTRWLPAPWFRCWPLAFPETPPRPCSWAH
ncbi:MAG: tripartite tricarboxylate transporter permease [Clostridium sp.]